jgi:hypothetical protein
VGGQRLARDIRQALVSRGDPDYESARAATLGDGLTPPRHPEVIVRASSVEDVREAPAQDEPAHRDGAPVRDGEGVLPCGECPGEVLAGDARLDGRRALGDAVPPEP